METTHRIEGWAADTSRPLGAIPYVFGAVCAAVVAVIMGSPIAWAVFACIALLLVVRGARWVNRQVEAARVERQMDQILERQPRLVPLFRPQQTWDQLRGYHKAS